MVEDISRFAFAEGSFGAGELNGQLRIDRRACADIGPEVYCSRFSRNSSVIGKRCVHIKGEVYKNFFRSGSLLHIMKVVPR